MVTLVLASFFSFVGCATQSNSAEPAVAEKPACVCADGKEGESVWCDQCNVGYADGKKSKCKGCWNAKSKGGDCAGCAKPEAKAVSADAADAKDSQPEESAASETEEKEESATSETEEKEESTSPETK